MTWFGREASTSLRPPNPLDRKITKLGTGPSDYDGAWDKTVNTEATSERPHATNTAIHIPDQKSGVNSPGLAAPVSARNDTPLDFHDLNQGDNLIRPETTAPSPCCARRR